MLLLHLNLTKDQFMEIYWLAFFSGHRVVPGLGLLLIVRCAAVFVFEHESNFFISVGRRCTTRRATVRSSDNDRRAHWL